MMNYDELFGIFHFPVYTFNKRCNLENHFVHYETFAELKKDFNEGSLSRKNLFVLDSSLTKEPDRRLIDFKTTVPWFFDRNLKRYVMPGSGGNTGAHATYGPENNRFFERFYRQRGYVVSPNQMGIAAFGLSGEPQSVIKNILTYYKEIFKNVDLEMEVPTNCEGAAQYWGPRLKDPNGRKL